MADIFFGMRISTMLRATSIALLALMFVSCATGHRQEKWESVPITGNKTAYRTRIENGLKLIVVEDKTSPTFAIQTWFDVGSMDEETGKTGLAHLFEHMMFKGTKNHPDGDFDRILDTAGAEGQNAFTGNDYTAYVQELPKDRLELILDLESDRMVNLIVNEDTFKTEREVVQNERRMRTENSPDGLMHQELDELAYQEHPYHWPVIGYQKDLDSMSGQDAQAFYRRHYSPEQATIVIAGDVERDAVLSLVRQFHGKIPARTTPLVRTVRPPERDQTSIRRKVLKLNMQVEKLLMALHIPEATHEDIPALTLLDAVLSGGESSRLQRSLVDTGIARTAWSHVGESKDPGLFMLGATLQNGKRALTAETVVQRELDKLRKVLVSTEEMQRAKNRLEFAFLEGLTTNSSIAHMIGDNEITQGRFEKTLEQYQILKKLTPEDLQRVAQKYFRPEGFTIIMATPKVASATQKGSS